MTDQQRFDAIRRTQEDSLKQWYYKHLKIRTPNLDKLSKSGAYFTNAYCQVPVCAPSRTGLRTGCTLKRHGVQTNDLIEENVYRKNNIFKKRIDRLVTFDHVLVEKYNYQSEYYGKWHIPNKLWFQRTKEENGDDIPVPTYNGYNHESEEFEFEVEHFGNKFRRYLKYEERLGTITKNYTTSAKGDKDNVVPLQTDTYTHFPYEPIQLDSRYGYPSNTDLFDKSMNFTSFEDSQSSTKGRYMLSEKYTPTYYDGNITLRALDRLLTEQHQQQSNNSSTNNSNSEIKPFLLTMSFHSPHPPMVPSSKHFDYYWNNRDKLFLPPSLDQPPPINTIYYNEKDVQELHDHGYSNKTKVREWIATYYACIQEIDDEVGKVMSKLDQYDSSSTTNADIINNTMIIFTSDHGEMLSSHGLRNKNKLYEEAVRVPLFIIYPNGNIQPNSIINEPVSLIDIYSTILDYVVNDSKDRNVPKENEEKDNNSDGTSLRRFIEKTSYNKDYDEQVVVVESDYRSPNKNNKLSKPLDFPKSAYMIRKGYYKLIIMKDSSSTKQDMLFNVKDDPYEISNLLVANNNANIGTIIGKAHHLKCLLIEWMERMDSSKGYYSNSKYNLYEGDGDIAEIRKRQLNSSLSTQSVSSLLWISDNIQLDFTSYPVWHNESNCYIRNEYLYMGSVTNDKKDVVNVNLDVRGTGSSFFSLDTYNATISGNNSDYEYSRVKVTYKSAFTTKQTDYWNTMSSNTYISITITTTSNSNNESISIISTPVDEEIINIPIVFVFDEDNENSTPISSPTLPPSLEEPTIQQTTIPLPTSPISSLTLAPSSSAGTTPEEPTIQHQPTMSIMPTSPSLALTPQPHINMSPSTVTSTNVTTTQANQNSTNTSSASSVSLSTGATVGIVLGCLFGLFLVFGCCFCLALPVGNNGSDQQQQSHLKNDQTTKPTTTNESLATIQAQGDLNKTFSSENDDDDDDDDDDNWQDTRRKLEVDLNETFVA